MPRISALPAVVTAQSPDEFPVVQGAVTKRVSFATAKASGMFLPAPGTIDTLELANDAVTSSKLESSVSNDALRAVTTDHIKDLAVTEPKLATDSVTTIKIKDLNVTNPKLASGSLSISKFNSVDEALIRASATARPGGYVAVSGGVENVVVYSGGTGYNNPASPPNVVFTPASPTGDNATAVAVVSGNQVTAINVTYPGSGYTVAPTITIDPPPVPGNTAEAYAVVISRGIRSVDGGNAGVGSQNAGFFITTDKKLKVVGEDAATSKNATGAVANNSILPTECAFQTNSSDPVKPWKVYAGHNNTYVIDTFGSVWSCGNYTGGSTGLGAPANVPILREISSSYFNFEPVVQLAHCNTSATNLVLARTAKNKIYGWGDQPTSTASPLGLGSPAADQPTPVQCATGFEISDMRVGPDVANGASMLILTGALNPGRLLVSGANSNQMLSQGNPLSTTPTPLATFAYYKYWNGAAAVDIGSGPEGPVIKALFGGSSSSGYTVILTAAGKVFTAGYNSYYQLGNGTVISTNNKVPANQRYATEVLSSDVVDIYVPDGAVGTSGFIFVKKSDGALYGVGYNLNGCFGSGAPASGGVSTSIATWTKIFDPTTYGTTVNKVVVAGTGGGSSYLLGNNNILYVAGSNLSGRLGTGAVAAGDLTTWAPTNLNLGVGVTIVDVIVDGGSSPRVLTSDGKVYTCGLNTGGALGNGSTTNRHTWANILF